VGECQVGGNIAPLLVSRSKDRLFVARRGEINALVSLAIDPTSGMLDVVAETPLTAKMSYLSLDHTGNFLFAVSYHNHSLTVCPLVDGKKIISHHMVIETPNNPHSLVFSPDNRYAVVASLGADFLLVYAFNERTGHLSPHTTTHWKARLGSGPRHFRFHPLGQFIYLLNELDAQLDVLAWNAANGHMKHIQTVDTLPATFTGKPWAADLHLTPDGRFLYTSERSSSTLAAFQLNQETGHAKLIGHTLTESQPRSFAVDQKGYFLMAVGQQSHHLSHYSIDSNSGLLTLQQRLPTGIEPIWIETV
jgi:6-phosphogluconolactonase